MCIFLNKFILKYSYFVSVDETFFHVSTSMQLLLGHKKYVLLVHSCYQIIFYLILLLVFESFYFLF